jgi:hypothetical protein
MGFFKKLSSDLDYFISIYRIILLNSEMSEHQQGEICGFEFFFSETEENLNQETLHILFNLIRETNSSTLKKDSVEKASLPSYSIEIFGSWTYNSVDNNKNLVEMPLQYKFTVRFFVINELYHSNQRRVGSISFKKPIPVRYTATKFKNFQAIPPTLERLISDLCTKQPY